jgi:peptidyl-prolyl cis-trans isomerase D
VNGRIISINDFRNALNQTVEFYSRMFGGKFDAAMQQQMRVRSSTMDRLINNEIASQAAEELGWHVTKAEIRDTIISLPFFQNEGKFDRSYYDTFLKNNRFSPAQFEKRLAKDRITEKTRKAFEAVLEPSELEIEKEFLANQTKLNLEFVKLDKDQLISREKIFGSAISNFLGKEENKKKIQDYYQLNIDKYSTKTEVRARHILIKTEKRSEEEALQKIQKIAEEAKSKNFGNLAAKYSEDMGTKKKKGDLGFFGAGKMEPAFEAAAMKLEVGKVSDPVKTIYGYHLIKIEERKEAKTKKVEEVQDEIAKNILAKEKVEYAFNGLKSMLKEGDLKEVEKAIKTWGLKWEETGLFGVGSASIPKVGSADAYPEVFALSKEKPLLDHTVDIGGRAFVMRFKERKLEGELDDEKREQLKMQLASGLMRDVYTKWIQELRKDSKVVTNTALLGGE